MKVRRIHEDDSGETHVPAPSPLSGGGMLTICGWNDVRYSDHEQHGVSCKNCLCMVAYCVGVSKLLAETGAVKP